jgi:selenocysteine-specific elongation factor
MIVATAGHIDHGKTALVKALTGVDADRLPEEKRRGITVDLGFAYLRLADGRSLGFVDVPGHEKLVRTMLAGATGVDYVMLVVAADDGIMPQTREHLAILDLLGLSNGVVALTKIDKVDASRCAAVSAEIRALLASSFLAGSPILPVSAQRGDGIEELRSVLASAADGTTTHRTDGGFRLAVDRAFTIAGAGLIVTGTIHAGRVAAGDRLMLASKHRDVRVRGLRAQNETAVEAVAGQRCALNIVGARVEKADIERGDWIIAPALSAPTQRIDVRLRLLPSEPKALRHWTPVHVHIGASDLSGRISLLERSSLAPGECALGQIVLDAPISAFFGDRFVLRDQSARRTIGGGHVIDPLPPSRNTRKPDRLAVLNAFDRFDDGAALDALLGVTGTGIDAGHFNLARNVDQDRFDKLVIALGAICVTTPAKTLLFTKARWLGLKARVVAALDSYQIKNPVSFGATTAEILRTAPAPEKAGFAAALEMLIRDKAVVRFGQLLHLSGHSVSLSPAEEILWQEIELLLRHYDLDPPRTSMIAEAMRMTEDEVKPLLEKLGRMGRLRRVAKVYFILPDIMRRLADAARDCAETHPEATLTVGAFREKTGISRHAVMPLLEFFDRIGFTSRHREGRRLRGHPEATFVPSEATIPSPLGQACEP